MFYQFAVYFCCLYAFFINLCNTSFNLLKFVILISQFVVSSSSSCSLGLSVGSISFSQQQYVTSRILTVFCFSSVHPISLYLSPPPTSPTLCYLSPPSVNHLNHLSCLLPPITCSLPVSLSCSLAIPCSQNNVQFYIKLSLEPLELNVFLFLFFSFGQ